MPVPTIGNISLPESASFQPPVHVEHQTLKGGFGNEPPERLIPKWPIPSERLEPSPWQHVVSAIDVQFEKRPWIMMAAVAGLGIVLGRLCVRRSSNRQGAFGLFRFFRSKR